MREVRIKVPDASIGEVMRCAREAGIDRAGITRERILGTGDELAVLSFETSTAKAGELVALLDRHGCLDLASCSMTIRELRSIVSAEHARSLTTPLLVPSHDVDQDLWLFSHVTVGHVVRVVVASGLLAYGLIRNELLTVAAGLLFLPVLPALLAISQGLVRPDRALAIHGIRATAASLALILAVAFAVGLLTGEPVRFTSFAPLGRGLLMSLSVGTAAAIATLDDVGRRELIGLATASQFAPAVATVGVGLGAQVDGEHALLERALSAVLSMLALVLSASATYATAAAMRRRRAERRPSVVTPRRS